jgi:hypothetical protein
MMTSIDSDAIKYFLQLCEKLNLLVSGDSEFLSKLDEAVFDFDNKTLDDLYYDTGLEKSDFYAQYYDEFDKIMFLMGFSETEWVDGECPAKHLYYETPWEEGGLTYDALHATNDFWWFLVVMIQRFGSSSTERSFDVMNRLLSHENVTSLIKKWMSPLSVLTTRLDLMREYESKNVKNFAKEDFSSVDLSNLKSIDITNIPEYDLDEYVHWEGNYYKPMDVWLAITASGGFAQALEKQDLEPKVTNSNVLLDKKKKPYKIGKKL